MLRISARDSRGGVGLSRGVLAITRGRAVVQTPAQTLIALALANGCSGLLLPTSEFYSAPLSAPGTLVDALGGDRISYTAQSAAGTPERVDDGSGPGGRPYLSANGLGQALLGSGTEVLAAVCFAVRPREDTTSQIRCLFANDNGGGGASVRFCYQNIWGNDNANDFAPASGIRVNGAVTNIAQNGEWSILTCVAASPRPDAVWGLFLSEYLSTRYWIGDLAGAAKWSTIPTSQQIVNIEAGLSAYTGIALTA